MKHSIADGSQIYWDGAHYDAFNVPYQDDMKFYLAEAKKARGPVLELACGTGRLTIPLAAAGVDVTGLDLAGPMLARARAKAAAAGVKPRFVKGDARSFSLGRFKLIFIAFNSMQHLAAREDIEGLFSSVARNLAPGGRSYWTCSTRTRAAWCAIPTRSCRWPITTRPPAAVRCW